jgi:hypothetical protein
LSWSLDAPKGHVQIRVIHWALNHEVERVSGRIDGGLKCDFEPSGLHCQRSKLSAGNFLKVRFQKGMTHSGSSGAALLDESAGAVIGQLFGVGSERGQAIGAFGRFEGAFRQGDWQQWMGNPR